MATIVLGVIGSDVHAIGNKILEYAFTEAGFKVVNLGVLTTKKEFVQAAIETDARAILVSSLYGHGEIDCRGLREMCIEAGIGDILLYVGETWWWANRSGSLSGTSSWPWDLTGYSRRQQCPMRPLPC